jgi:hypothetical protein
MDGFSAFLMLLIFAAVAIYLLFVLPAQLRGRERARLYELLKYGYDKGQPVPPDLIRELMRKPVTTRDRDIRWGAVILSAAIGLGICGFALFALWQWGGFQEPLRTWIDQTGRERIDYPNTGMRDFGITLSMLAIMPLCVGFTLLMLGVTKKREDV